MEKRFGTFDTNITTSTPDNCKITNEGSVTSSNRHIKCPANPSLSEPQCDFYDINKVGNADCENCTSWIQIYRDFVEVYPGTEDDVSMLFTGNVLYEDDGSSTGRSYYWDTYKSGVTGIIINSNVVPAAYYENTLATVVHEVAHHFEVPDHYHEPLTTGGCRGGAFCIECNPSGGRPEWCIMSNSNIDADVLEAKEMDEIFCPGCLNDIKNYWLN